MKQIIQLFTICFVITFAAFQILAPIPASASNKISKTEPQMMGTPEKDLSTFGSDGKKSNVAIWLGALAGVALIAALAGGGGGGGDDGGSTTTSSEDTGSLTVEW